MAIRLQNWHYSDILARFYWLELCFWPMVTRCEKSEFAQGSQRCSNKAQWGWVMEATWKMLFLLSDVEFSKNCRFFWLLFFVTVPALLDVTIPSSTVGHPRCPSILLANKKAKAGCVGHIQPAFLLLVWMQLGCYLNPTSAGHFSVISPWMVKVGLEMQLPIVIESYLVYSFFSLSCLSSSTQHNSVRRIDFNIDFNRCLTSW